MLEDQERREDKMPEETPTPNYIMPSVSLTEGLLQQQIDPTRVIESIENSLLGKKIAGIDKTGMPTYTIPQKRLTLMNERGVRELCFDLEPRLSYVFQLSIFEDRHIENITITFGKAVNDALFEHWDEWGIVSVSAASRISRMIVDVVFSNLRKAYMGRYLRSISTTQSMQEIQQIRQEPPQQKSSILGSMPVVNKFFPSQK